MSKRMRRASSGLEDGRIRAASDVDTCIHSMTGAANPQNFQDALLRLSSVISPDQLQEAVTEAIKLTLTNVSDAIVYLASLDPPHELTSTHGLLHTLPKDGLTRDVVEKKERIVVDGLDAADPLSGLLKSSPTEIIPSRKVVCSPVVDRENDRVIAVLVIVCDALSSEDHQNVSFLEKHILVCHKRLKQTASATTTTVSSSPAAAASSPSNHAQRLLRLCAELSDQDARLLQVKIIKYLMEHTSCKSAFLLLVDPQHREIFCQVIGETVLQEEIRFPTHGPQKYSEEAETEAEGEEEMVEERVKQDTENSFARAMRNKTCIGIDEVDMEQRLLIEEQLGYPFESLLCVPLCLQTNRAECNAIVCLVNKKLSKSFNDEDQETVMTCFKYTANVLNSTLTVQSERRLKNQTQALLQVAKNLFTHLDDLTKLLREIMQEARNLTKAERCSVFLLDKESDELCAKVFDGDIRDGMNEMTTEVRIPATQGIAGHVATTGKILNIDDAYSHPLFYRGVDTTTGFRTRNILCFPIKNETGEVIGVAQLCNKINGAGFSIYDEDIAQAFSVYCCISIVHSLMYKKVRDAQVRSKLSNELMMHHMQVEQDTVKTQAVSAIPPVFEIHPKFDQFYFTPRSMVYDETAVATMSMFEDMGFIQRYRIKREPLAKFVMMVRKGYRDPPYHNWAHAFAVGHFCYLMYKNADLLDYIDDIEAFALFVSCLCHDIDHRGTTNSYQVASGSVLASLYSSEGSVLERHHLAQTMCILNTEGCNIFESLNRQEYTRVLDLIRDIILATDLAHHLRIVKDLEKIASGGYSKHDQKERSLLLCLLMTSCDLSDQTKNWNNTRKIAELIYNEFFSQGDLEKALGRKPMAMMDREKACIPELQIDFLDGIALPVYRILGTIFPAASKVVAVVEGNRKMWVKMNNKVKALGWVSDSSMDVLQMELGVEEEEDDFDDEYSTPKEEILLARVNGKVLRSQQT